MKNWLKVKGNRLLFWLAVASFVIATLEGVLYYAGVEDLLFRVMLTAQNSIKAFGFSASIGLKDAMSFMLTDPTPFKTVVGYAYAVAVFVAPYCSLAFVYKVLERVLKLAGRFNRDRRSGSIVIFGYNDAVRQLLDHNSDEDRGFKRRTYLVWNGEIPDAERYRLLKEGVTLQKFDPLKVAPGELEARLAQLRLDRADYVLLFEESSIQNFSLLQTLSRDVKWLGERTKVFCRCEDEGIYRVVESYYDTPQADKSKHRPFDLEIVNIPELQVRKMYEDHPLHEFYSNRKNPPALKDWRTHLLILGFGQLGQQALLQAMNLGVVHSGNDILIDVVDLDMARRGDVFLSRFASEAFVENGEGEYTFNPAWADGKLELRFHRMDVRYQRFRQLLDTLAEESAPFTYVVVAMDQPDVSVHCIHELRQHLERRGEKGVPILLRMDSDRRLRNYVNGGKEAPGFGGVHVVGTPAELLSFRNLFDAETDQIAKRCNYHYAAMTFARLKREIGESTGTGPAPDGVERAWQALTLFKRNANRAAAYHNRVLETVFPVLLRDTGADEDAFLTEAFIGPRALVAWAGSGQWDYGLTDVQFLDRAGTTPPALEALLCEHRRWCYYTASIGWALGEKDLGEGRTGNDPELRLNPCLVPWAVLTRTKADMCKYDLMPLMELAEARFGEKGTQTGEKK